MGGSGFRTTSRDGYSSTFPQDEGGVLLTGWDYEPPELACDPFIDLTEETITGPRNLALLP